MLTGEELLAKVKEMGGASKSEVVKACGYVSQKKDGSDRLNFTAFYEALLEAKGVGIGSGGGVGSADTIGCRGCGGNWPAGSTTYSSQADRPSKNPVAAARASRFVIFRETVI